MILAVIRSLDLPFSDLTRIHIDGPALQTKEKIVTAMQGLALLGAVGGSFYLPLGNWKGRVALLSAAVIALSANYAIFCHLDKIFSGGGSEEKTKQSAVYQMQLCGFILAGVLGRLAASDLLEGSRYMMTGIQSRDVLHFLKGASWIFRTLGYDALLSWLFFRFSTSHFSLKTLERWEELAEKMGKSPLGGYLKEQMNTADKLFSSHFVLTASLMIDECCEEETFSLAARFVQEKDLKGWLKQIQKDLADIHFAKLEAHLPKKISGDLPSCQEEPGFYPRIANVFDQSISILISAAVAASQPKASGLGAAGGFVFSKIFPEKSCAQQTPAPSQPKGYLSYIQFLANRFALLWFGASPPTAVYSGASLFFTAEKVFRSIS